MRKQQTKQVAFIEDNVRKTRIAFTASGNVNPKASYMEIKSLKRRDGVAARPPFAMLFRNFTM